MTTEEFKYQKYWFFLGAMVLCCAISLVRLFNEEFTWNMPNLISIATPVLFLIWISCRAFTTPRISGDFGKRILLFCSGLAVPIAFVVLLKNVPNVRVEVFAIALVVVGFLLGMLLQKKKR